MLQTHQNQREMPGPSLLHSVAHFIRSPRLWQVLLCVDLSMGFAAPILAAEETAETALPRLLVTADDTRITQSCVIVIPPGLIIADTNNNGVLHLEASGITVRFDTDSILRGAPDAVPWSELTGTGIRIIGRNDITLIGARVHGFKTGLWATAADGLTLATGDFSDNFRQRLRSSPEAEDAEDWLYPHHNDERKWREEYGAAICVESSRHVTLRDIRVRRGQNGILLDRVDDSRVYDNDCSFLSGWGLAMWRSSRNRISRNAFDFCVRGHAEGVYNRGQDSAGILCFEQCNDNLFIENSATHGGDGFFGFAGRDALGELWMAEERQRLRHATGRDEVDALVRVPEAVLLRHADLGCNSNVFVGNDFSYASAHGLELTFSRGNRIVANRLVENAICGIWGGYSSHTLIVSNQITGNGGMAYGLERGGINMEHASDNTIIGNELHNNRCAIHLWWDNDANLFQLPGVKARNRGVSGNFIAGNIISVDDQHPFQPLKANELLIGLHLRDATAGRSLTNNTYLNNLVRMTAPQARETLTDPGCELRSSGALPPMALPAVTALGHSQPVGARRHLRGRNNIIIDEWGPWDHESAMVRRLPKLPNGHLYDLLGFSSPAPVRILHGSVHTELLVHAGQQRLRITADPGVHPYQVVVGSPGQQQRLEGTLIGARWNAVFFNWSTDPREDLEGWRKHSLEKEAVAVALDQLELTYGWNGPKNMNLSSEMADRGPGSDRFGMIARTRLLLPAAKWRFSTLSDDGVRVLIDGNHVLENWTWHGPTRDSGIFEQSETREVEVVVEHFEIDGYAVLQLAIDQVQGP